MILSALMVLIPPQWVVQVMQLLAIPFSFKLFILFMAGIHLCVAMLAERHVFPLFAGWIGSWMGRTRNENASPKRSHVEVARSDFVGHAPAPSSPESRRPLMGPDEFDVVVSAPDPGRQTRVSGKIYKAVEEEMRAT